MKTAGLAIASELGVLIGALINAFEPEEAFPRSQALKEAVLFLGALGRGLSSVIAK